MKFRIAAALLALSLAADASAAVDSIYFGGPIVTVSDANPTIDAIAVQGGKIVAVGKRRTLQRKLGGPATRMIDLQGKTLVPGFIDAHSHITNVGMVSLFADLMPPPDGHVNSIASVQAALRDHLSRAPLVRDYGVLIGWGYDDAQLLERRHPTRADLDAVSAEIPIMIVHQSGHLAVYNSIALARGGITAATPDPVGGHFRRDAAGELTGVAEENAHQQLGIKLLPKFSSAEAIAQIEAGQAVYLRNGITTIQDGRTRPDQLQALIKAAEAGLLKADVVAYPDMIWNKDSPLMKSPWVSREYQQHLRIGGVKLSLDGSPQGKTAWLSQPYLEPPAGKGADYRGYGIHADGTKVDALVTQAFKNGWQVLAHANGDAAIDQFIGAVRSASVAVPGTDRRPVAIHAQTLRLDQVAKFKELGIFPALFPSHTFYWGDWHVASTLGPERARDISPTGWLRQADMMFSAHHDAPVTTTNMLRVLSATVTRVTRSGQVLGPDQRVDSLTGLKAITLWPAYQYFEERQKGSIEVGKLADFAILSANPVTVPPEHIIDIRVLETIKQDVSVFRVEGEKAARSPESRSCSDSTHCTESFAATAARDPGFFAAAGYVACAHGY